MNKDDICMLVIVVFLLIVSIHYLMDDSYEGQDVAPPALPQAVEVEEDDVEEEEDEVEEDEVPVEEDVEEEVDVDMEEAEMEEAGMEEAGMEEAGMEEAGMEEAAMAEQESRGGRMTQGPYGMSGDVIGYDDMNMYASVDSPYGDVVPVSMQQEYALLKSLGKIMPGEEVKLDGYGQEMDSTMPAFDPSSKGGLMDSQKFQGEESPSGDGKEFEVHMVYAEWCGHSQNAKPAFKELVDSGGILTDSGASVKFVMTEEEDPSFKMFEGKIQGFPTFMTVVKENGEVTGMEELDIADRSPEAIATAAKALV